MQAIILAAGAGTRLKPLTETLSKPMISVANKPIIEWSIKSLEDFVDEIIIVVNKNEKNIQDFFKDKNNISFAVQEKQTGTANAMQTAEEFIDDRFIVVNSDDFIHRDDIKKLSKSKGNMLGVFEVNNPQNFGVVDIDNNRITNIIEKPKNPKSNLANCGLYLFNKSIFSAIKQTKLSIRGEYEITDSIKILMKKEDFYAQKLSRWVTINYPWDLLDVNKFMLEEFGSMISNDVEMRPGVHIEYPVAIGHGSIIGPNCFIRKYSSIGSNCRVGQGVEIKNSIIMDASFVSHLAYVGDSIIGRNCNIAAGVKFANLRLDEKNIWMKINGKNVDTGHTKMGSIVGDNVKFGVNSTVMPGKKIWPNIMIPPCNMVKDDVTKQVLLKE
jgi:bifunctional UDP-N-acetylglucosamine pyrophosphorylase/glucosamine-1-phosphate N-acetyltransferase